MQEAREYMKEVGRSEERKNQVGNEPVKEIVFEGEPFTPLCLLRYRKQLGLASQSF